MIGWRPALSKIRIVVAQYEWLMRECTTFWSAVSIKTKKREKKKRRKKKLSHLFSTNDKLLLLPFRINGLPLSIVSLFLSNALRFGIIITVMGKWNGSGARPLSREIALRCGGGLEREGEDRRESGRGEGWRLDRDEIENGDTATYIPPWLDYTLGVTPLIILNTSRAHNGDWIRSVTDWIPRSSNDPRPPTCAVSRTGWWNETNSPRFGSGAGGGGQFHFRVHSEWAYMETIQSRSIPDWTSPSF